MAPDLFTTERLAVREIGIEDVLRYKAVIDACGTTGIADDLLGLSDEEFTDRHRAYITYQYGFFGYGIWGVYLRDTDTMIGIAGIWNSDESGVGEMGYALLPAYRHQGYAFEACSGIIDYNRDWIGFDRFIVRIPGDNKASLALAARLHLDVFRT